MKNKMAAPPRVPGTTGDRTNNTKFKSKIAEDIRKKAE
jgi:hypothetical protein